MIKILFVCHGNICRSTMAEFLMKDLVEKAGYSDKIRVDSAATSQEEIGNDTHEGTKQELRKHHIPFTPRKARQVIKEDYQTYDFIICMDNQNIFNVKRLLGPDVECKIFKALSFTGQDRDVADPWYTGDFEATYADISEACQALLDFLVERYSLDFN